MIPHFNKAVLEPRVSPAFAITSLFSKNLNQRSLTPRWPLTPCLLRSHVWLYPRIIVSKSHDDTSMYVDTVINFANYHIHTYTYYVHTTYILHTTYRMSDHIVSYWTQSLTELSSGETITELSSGETKINENTQQNVHDFPWITWFQSYTLWLLKVEVTV